MLAERYNLIVLKWGNKYSPAYVLNLYNSARARCSIDFNFIVFTDNTDGLAKDLGWQFIKLPDWGFTSEKAWWYKLEIFSKHNSILGNNLYIDLDVVIIDDILPFWEFEPTKFRICRDFNRAFIRNYQNANSSIMAWKDDSMHYLWNSFVKEIKSITQQYRGDQDYINKQMRNSIFWPDKWAVSWKWEAWRGGKINSTDYRKSELKTVIHDDTKILVFHGNPKPHECDDILVKNIWSVDLAHKIN